MFSSKNGVWLPDGASNYRYDLNLWCEKLPCWISTNVPGLAACQWRGVTQVNRFQSMLSSHLRLNFASSGIGSHWRCKTVLLLAQWQERTRESVCFHKGVPLCSKEAQPEPIHHRLWLWWCFLNAPQHARLFENHTASEINPEMSGCRQKRIHRNKQPTNRIRGLEQLGMGHDGHASPCPCDFKIPKVLL